MNLLEKLLGAKKQSTSGTSGMLLAEGDISAINCDKRETEQRSRKTGDKELFGSERESDINYIKKQLLLLIILLL